MMLEESMSTVPSSSSLWSSIFSWFTPTVIFVFVNLTIGTIFFTSTFSSNKPGPTTTAAADGVGEAQTLQEEDEKNDPKLVTSSSALQTSHRSKVPVTFTSKIPDVGADFYLSFHQQTTPSHPPPSPPLPQQQPKEEAKEIQAPKEVENEVTRGFDEIHNEVTRTKSDVEPASGALPIKLARQMRKSASVKSPFSHFKEDEILEARRPASVRESKAKVTVEDDEVDAKADDFINKFKQQLKLQRIFEKTQTTTAINSENGLVSQLAELGRQR